MYILLPFHSVNSSEICFSVMLKCNEHFQILKKKLTFLEIKIKILKEGLIASWLDLTFNIYLVMGKNLLVEWVLPLPYIPQIFAEVSGKVC